MKTNYLGLQYFCEDEDYDDMLNAPEDYPVAVKTEENHLSDGQKPNAPHDTESLLNRLRKKFAFAEPTETFSEMLLRLMCEKGIKPSACYKRANVDRRLFNKIKKNKYYSPTKNTVLAFTIAIGLDYEQARKFLQSAGYAFCYTNVTDVVVSHYIKERRYNIDKINFMLFTVGQPLLGVK